MSDADRPPREWRFYIADMLEFAEKVLAYTKDVDEDTLVANPLRLNAADEGVTRRVPTMENVPWPAVNSSRRC